jgi:creatinine amidohydrolase
MSHSILDLPSPDVADAIARSPIAVIPFGSTEQHGPHLPCGTDVMAAELIAADVAERLDALLVPFGPYGVTPIHAGHPGTISLRPETFEALLRDVVCELAGAGVSAFVLVNWHELNTPSLDRVATDLQDQLGLVMVVAQACYVAQRVYAPAGGELTHGGGIEALAVLAQDPALARLERAAAVSRPPGAAELDAMRRSREVYGFVTDIAEFGDGGWYGEPAWASDQDASAFAATVGAEVAARAADVVAVRRRQPPGADGGHARSGGTDG